MPLYIYKCKQCGEKFEFLMQHKIQRSSKDEVPSCPKCLSIDLEKLPTTYGIKMWQTSR